MSPPPLKEQKTMSPSPIKAQKTMSPPHFKAQKTMSPPPLMRPLVATADMESAVRKVTRFPHITTKIPSTGTHDDKII